MKLTTVIIGLWIACLTPANCEIVINDFLSFEGFVDSSYIEPLKITKKRPKEASVISFYFQIAISEQIVFSYYKDGDEEKIIFTADVPYQVTTIHKSGILAAIEIRKKEAPDLLYKIQVEDQELTIAEAPSVNIGRPWSEGCTPIPWLLEVEPMTSSSISFDEAEMFLDKEDIRRGRHFKPEFLTESPFASAFRYMGLINSNQPEVSTPFARPSLTP